MATTFRADIRAGMYASLVAFNAANPTLLPGIHRVRPTTYTGDMPFAYVDILAETATHTSGTRERVLSPSVVVVSRPIENDAQTDAWDILVDLLADHFTTYAHFAPNTIWSAWSVTDESDEIAERTFPIVRFTFSNVSIREGRN